MSTDDERFETAALLIVAGRLANGATVEAAEEAAIASLKVSRAKHEPDEMEQERIMAVVQRKLIAARSTGA